MMEFINPREAPPLVADGHNWFLRYATVVGGDHEANIQPPKHANKNRHQRSKFHAYWRAILLSAAACTSTNIGSALADPIIGVHNVVITPVSIVLAGPFPINLNAVFRPIDTLLDIRLLEIKTWEEGQSIPPSLPCPQNTPVNCTTTLSYEHLLTYSKTATNTLSTTVQSELSSQFAGIGNKLSAAFATSYTVGTQESDTRALKLSETVAARPGDRLDWIQDNLWVQYSGEYKWYESGIFGIIPPVFHLHDPWSVLVNYHSVLYPVITTPFTHAVPEPASFALFVGGLLSLAAVVRRKRSRRGQ